MKILNLVYPEKSDIKWKPSKFPDGQQNIVIDSKINWSEGVLGVTENLDSRKFNPSKIVQIKSRLNNWLDLELIICAVASLRNLYVEEIHLYTPYIIGARSDRKFEEGGNNYLKDVICPIINSLKFKTVTCIDPHSHSLECCIKNFKKESNLQLIRFVLTPPLYYPNTKDNFILISPDAGASHKIYKLAEQIGYKGDIITCSKERDTEGKLTKIVVPIKDTGPLCKKDYIIIDDICDGGATFINIAQELKKLYNCNHIYLIVTHGIFSKGFEELFKYFDGVYCTNSYKDLSGYEFTTRKAIQIERFVKQLNVF